MKHIKKIHIYFTTDILSKQNFIKSNQEHRNSIILENYFFAEIIIFIYIIFKVIQKFKISFDINLHISAKKTKNPKTF